MSNPEVTAEEFEQPAGPPLVPATPRELKQLIKDWRGGRATRNVLQAISDAYVALIGALMIGAMVINVILQAQKTLAQCSTESCLSARTILPWAAFAAAVAVALGASRLFGPVLASAAGDSGCSTLRSRASRCSAPAWWPRSPPRSAGAW